MSAGRPIRHRRFSRCVVCDRDIACWEDNDWWHLDSDFIIDHRAFPKEDEMNTNPPSGVVGPQNPLPTDNRHHGQDSELQGFYSYRTDLQGDGDTGAGVTLSVRVCMDCGAVVADNLRNQHNGWHKRMNKAGAHYHETWDSAQYTGSAISAIVPGQDGCVSEHSPATNPECEMAPADQAAEATDD